MSDELVQRLRMSAETAPHWLRPTYFEVANEIERLQMEVVELRGDRDSWRGQAEDRMDDWTDMRDRADTAESALAALRKRIEEAPVVEWSREDWIDHCDSVSPSYIGMRVALVVLGEGGRG